MLFDKYYSEMYAVAYRYVKVREDAEDSLSEAFVRVFKSIGSFVFQGEGSLRRWVKTIVINEALRTLNRRQRMVFTDGIDNAELVIADELELETDMGHFLSMVDTLPDGYRVVFLMYVVEEFSHKEIAEKLNISVSTSKSQLFKARAQIVNKMKKIEDYETFGHRATV